MIASRNPGAILVIEDEPNISALVVQYLEKAGYDKREIVRDTERGCLTAMSRFRESAEYLSLSDRVFMS